MLKWPVCLKMLALAAVVAVLLVPSLALAQGSTAVKITEKEFSLTPSAITVPRGQPVTFTVTNSGTIEHNFAIEIEGQNNKKTLFATNLKPGETRTAQFTFTADGDWKMDCPIANHEDLGMKGTISVVAASGQATTPTQLPRSGGVPLAAAGVVGMLGVVLAGAGWTIHRRGRARV